MSRYARWTTVGLVIAAAACGDIATPVRIDFYEWRLIVPSTTGPGNDSITFHWPRSRLPVRIWVEDAAGLPANVPSAIAAWREAYLYGEFDATVVSDSSTADVIVRAGAAPGIQFSRVRLHSAMATECEGATDLDISDDHTDLQLPIRMYVDPRSDPAAPGLAACLALTTTHEMGHVLGIWSHSAVATDIMFAEETVTAPSERDLETAEVIYHLPSNIQLVDRNPGEVPVE